MTQSRKSSTSHTNFISSRVELGGHARSLCLYLVVSELSEGRGATLLTFTLVLVVVGKTSEWQGTRLAFKALHLHTILLDNPTATSRCFYWAPHCLTGDGLWGIMYGNCWIRSIRAPIHDGTAGLRNRIGKTSARAGSDVPLAEEPKSNKPSPSSTPTH